jgi:hypothetical protein
MVASININLTSPNFLLTENFICYCRFQVFKLCPILKESAFVFSFVNSIEGNKLKLHRQLVEDEIKFGEGLPTFSSESYLASG